MDQEQVIDRVRRYADLVRKDLPVRKVVLFGSQLNGNAREDSDIDVAVIVDHVEGDFLTAEARLFRLGRSIDLRIEPVLLEEGSDPSGFQADILRQGRVIYSAA